MIWHDLARTERIAMSFPRRWLKGYARGKLWTDPVYRAAWELLGSSALPLLDVGCGIGLLGFYLRERGYAGDIVGFDTDAQKVEQGMSAAAGKPNARVNLEVGDCTALPEFSGHVAMLDVLQYLPPRTQEEVLDDLAARVAPGAWCIIRTTPRDGSWRFRVTERMERFAHRREWMAQPAIAFPTLNAVQSHFPLGQFEQDIRPLWGRTPFNSWLLAFRRGR